MGVNAIALVLVASFAIDRVVNGVLFLVSYSEFWRRKFPDPALVDADRRVAAQKKQKLIYFVFAGLLGTVLLAYFGQVRVLSSLGVPANPYLDVFITGLILMGGADRVAELLKATGAGGAGAERSPSSGPIEIKGTLTLEQPSSVAQFSKTGTSGL